MWWRAPKPAGSPCAHFNDGAYRCDYVNRWSEREGIECRGRQPGALVPVLIYSQIYVIYIDAVKFVRMAAGKEACVTLYEHLQPTANRRLLGCWDFLALKIGIIFM